MRQWELFGITDSDPTWTAPPRPAAAVTDVSEATAPSDGFARDLEVLRLAVEAQDERVPEPAA
jgi:hypothetical protein